MEGGFSQEPTILEKIDLVKHDTLYIDQRVRELSEIHPGAHYDGDLQAIVYFEDQVEANTKPTTEISGLDMVV